MPSSLRELYPNEFEVLTSLFGTTDVHAKLNRLDEIFQYTEQKWNAYVRLLPDQCVKYLLIAEAPPWIEVGPPQYLLDPGSRPRSLMKAIRSAFCLNRSAGDGSANLADLACGGFLLVDSTPFSMDYSAAQRRSRKKYRDLIGLTAKTYLAEKLKTGSLSWSHELRIAFAVKLNAAPIIDALQFLDLGGRRFLLSPDMIAVNGAGYLDAPKLRACYALPAARER